MSCLQAVSNASSQLLQPLLAFASAPHKAVFPWRSAESDLASGSLEAEPDRPCTQSKHASVALDQASEPLEADRRCTQPEHASVALDHASGLLQQDRPRTTSERTPVAVDPNRHLADSEAASVAKDCASESLEAGRGTAPQQTPVCMRRPSQALVEEMLESPVTISKPLPQPEGACCFRRQSNLGMQGLITDSAAQNSSSTDLHVKQDRQGNCSAFQPQPASQFVEAAGADAKPAKCNDHNSEAMPDISTLTAVCRCDRVCALGPADASKSAQNCMAALGPAGASKSAQNCMAALASECRQVRAQVGQAADASEASCNSHATDESEAVTVRRPVTAATDQHPATHPAAAVDEHQSQPEQLCSGRLDLEGDTDAGPQPQTKANATDPSFVVSDRLNALMTGMYTYSVRMQLTIRLVLSPCLNTACCACPNFLQCT